MGARDEVLLEEASGLEVLERAERARVSVAGKVLAPLSAVALFLLAWQVIVWTGWRESYVLPGPIPVLRTFFREIANGHSVGALATTMRRAGAGYGFSIVIGGAIGIAVARIPLLRAAIGSMITGLQTMPSIAWFPLAILVFRPTESAILFVVILGAAPSVANGLIAGIDHVPPILLRAGDVLGAKGLARYRHIVIPAALPSLVSGLKQAWAFAWRSLMAGELLVQISFHDSIGAQLDNARQLSDAEGLIAAMVMIFIVGVVIDAAFFSTLERKIRARRGLTV